MIGTEPRSDLKTSLNTSQKGQGVLHLYTLHWGGQGAGMDTPHEMVINRKCKFFKVDLNLIQCDLHFKFHLKKLLSTLTQLNTISVP